MQLDALRKRLTDRSGPRSFGTWFGLGVSLICLALAFRGVNTGEVIAALSQTEPVLLLVAFLSVMLSSIGSTMRWRELLHPFRPQPGRLFQVFMISHLGNTLLPWKLGTLLRTYLVADAESIGRSFVIGTVAVERLLDILILALLFLAILPSVAFPRWLHDSGLSRSLTILPLVLLLVAIIYSKPQLLAELRPRGGVDLPAPLNWLAQFLNQGLRSLDVLARPGQYVAIVTWSLVIWGAGALTNGLALAALGIRVPVLASIVLLVTLQIGNKVPTMPANIGVFHYVAILTLGLFGVDRAVALSYALVLHAVVFLAPAVVGGLCLWKWQRDFGGLHLASLSARIRRATQESRS